MINNLSRTEILIGNENINKIKNKKIIVFGLGGVGSYCVEALVRSGVMNITIVDNDTISITNLNRQLYALNSTLGQMKTDVAYNRIIDINPLCKVTKINLFYNTDTYDKINLKEYDYVIDCIDTITSKIHLAEYCYFNKIKMISSMGTGNRLDPTKFKITDIYKTYNDPVAKVLRIELKKRNVLKLKVLFSEEPPKKILSSEDLLQDTSKRSIIGSISFVPPVAGMIIASFVINDLMSE